MKRRRIGVLAAIAVTALAATVTALATAGPGNGRAPFTLPSKARAVAPDVFALGVAKDKGRTVQGYAFVHRRDAEAKGGKKGKPGGGGGGGSSCFAYLANGAKWRNAEDWIVNTGNSHGLTRDQVLDTLSASVTAWETAAGNPEIFRGGSTVTDTLVADTLSTDGVNEVYFGEIDDPGVIAVTIVWGIFRGPPSSRELVEWDQVYDDVDYKWSLDPVEAYEMDFDGLAKHEVGHAAGMGHPDDSCIDETMYRFASNGETTKRDLNGGDIAGILALY